MKKRGNAKALVIILSLLSAALLAACGAAGDDRKLLEALSGTAQPAATVVGMGSCTQCHYGSVSEWLQTPHANTDPLDSSNLDYAGNPALGDVTAGACKNCHDLDTDSAGLIPNVTGNVARPVVGCEACHGGGSNHNGSGPIGPSRLGAATFGTVAVSGWMNTCNACHELLDATGAYVAAPAHSVVPPVSADNTLTDTHAATPLAWSDIDGQYGGAEPAATGYAMDFSAETVCADCHAMHGENDSIRKEWAKSAHADRYALTEPDTGPESFFSTAWAHYNWSCDGSSPTSCGTGSRKACQRCHTTTAFKAYADALRRGDTSTAEAINSGATPPVPYSTAFKPEMLKCDGCHTDTRGTLRNPGAITANYDLLLKYPTPVDPEKTYSSASYAYPDIAGSNVCMSCHTGRENGETIRNLNTSGMPSIDLNKASFINSHYLTGGGTVFGATGYEFPGRDYADPSAFRHSKIGTASEPNTGTNGPCVGCHMSRPGGSGDHLFLPVSRDAALGVTGIPSEACFVCHVIPNNLLTESTQERREEFHMALEAAKRALGTPGFYFATTHPYFFNPRTNKGMVTVTNGVATVTGVGTSWLSAGIVTTANARKPTTADLFSADDGKYYTIATITDDTHIELSTPYEGPTNAVAHPYAILRIDSNNYTTGKVSVTNGSKTVTGTGTTWLGVPPPPPAGIVTGVGGTPFRDSRGVYYWIDFVVSATELTLMTAYAGATATAQSYSIVKNFNEDKGAFVRGTVTLTDGSPVVTGTGTDWTTAGIVPGTSGDVFIDDDTDVFYTIKSVDSDTQLTLASNYAGAGGAAQLYTIIRYGGANAITDWDPTNAGGTNGGTFAKHNMGAAFNYNLLEHDPGAYIHNSYYARRLLYDTIDWADDYTMNFSVGATLNAAVGGYREGAMQYLLPNGVLTGIAAERP